MFLSVIKSELSHSGDEAEVRLGVGSVGRLGGFVGQIKHSTPLANSVLLCRDIRST